MFKTADGSVVRRAFLAGIVLVLGQASTPDARAQGNPNPGIVPPNAHPHGHTYGEWSARFWQWAYSLPVNYNPLTDTAPVGAGQTGDVWFLGGTFTSTTNPAGQTVGIATRSVTIPHDKSLFFPVANSEASFIEGNGSTYSQLSLAAKGFQDSFTTMSCEIDGRPVKDLQSYRVQSPLYVFGPLPADNLIQYFGINAPAGTTSESVGDGVYLFLSPLSLGRHTIHFHAEAPAFNFLLDITYHIHVVRGDGD